MVRATIRAVELPSADTVTATVEYELKYASTNPNIVLQLTVTKNDFYLWKDSHPTGTILEFLNEQVKDVYQRIQKTISWSAGLEGKAFDW